MPPPVPHRTLRRVLLLDWPGHYSESWIEDARLLVNLVTFGNRESIKSVLWYHGGASFAAQIAATIKDEKYDFILLGGNMGNGLEIAKLLPLEAAKKTVVVTHLMPSGYEVAEYGAFGITEFSTRAKALELLERLIAMASVVPV